MRFNLRHPIRRIMDRIHSLAVQAGEQIAAHPIVSTVGAVSAALVSVLQNSQAVASTLMALFTSLAGAVTAFLALRSAWRNRNKGKE